MKYYLRFIKDWSHADGTKYSKGKVYETDDKELAASLLIEGAAEKVDKSALVADGADGLSDDDTAVIKGIVDASLKTVRDDVAKLHTVIDTHDKSDDDPSFGYIRPRDGIDSADRLLKHVPRCELEHGFALFAKDVHECGPSPSRDRLPERLRKGFERSEKCIAKGIAGGWIKQPENKAAGSGWNVGVDSEGGVLIPPVFSLMLLDDVLAQSTIRPRAMQMPVDGLQVKLPQWSDYNRSGSLLASGARGYWKGENVQATESQGKYEEVSLNLHALTALAYVSHEMLTFSPLAMGPHILNLMAQAITFKEEDGFLNGSGVGQPLGILQSPALLSVAIETGQTLAASAIVTENLLKMTARTRKSGNTNNIVWLYYAPDSFVWLSKLKMDVGTGGAAVGIVDRMPNEPDFRLLGRPLVENEHIQALGTVGDIVLANLNEYVIADNRGGPEIAQSIHLKFDYGQTAYRIIKYTDGQSRYSSAFTPQNATATSASFTAIAVRT